MMDDICYEESDEVDNRDAAVLILILMLDKYQALSKNFFSALDHNNSQTCILHIKKIKA